MNLYFIENWTKTITSAEGQSITYQGDFLNDSIPFKARFSVKKSTHNTDLVHIDATFQNGDIHFETSRGNILKAGIAIKELKPWLIKELKANEESIYKNNVIQLFNEHSIPFSYEVLSDIEPYKIKYTYIHELKDKEWTVVVETSGDSLKHSGDTEEYSEVPFNIKGFIDDFTIKKIAEIESFKKIKIYQ